MAEIVDLPYASTKVRFMVICAKDYAVKLSSLGICSSVAEALWLRCDRVPVTFLLRCCCIAVVQCRRRVVGIFLYGIVEKTLGGIWRCSTPKKASEEGIFARKGGLYAIYLHKDFAAVQINCTFAADFTN